jgi:hypothetical protein
MPFAYDNSVSPYLSYTTRTWDSPQDLGINDANIISLWVKGYRASQSSFTGTGPFTMTGATGKIAGKADQFFYAYKAVNNTTGACSITVKINSFTGPNDISKWAKAGIMIRETAAADSPMVMVAMGPTGMAQRRHREAQGSAAGANTAAGISFPHWLKLSRSGNTFEMQHSADGKTWEAIGNSAAVSVSMRPDVLIGLEIASYGIDQDVAAAVFSNLTIEGAADAWTQTDVGLKFNAPDSVYVTIEDSTGKSYTSVHPDAAVHTVWTQLKLDTAKAVSAGVNIHKIKKIVIGVGNKTAPVKSGTGMLCIDDLSFGRSL